MSGRRKFHILLFLGYISIKSAEHNQDRIGYPRCESDSQPRSASYPVVGPEDAHDQAVDLEKEYYQRGPLLNKRIIVPPISYLFPVHIPRRLPPFIAALDVPS